MRYLVVGMGVQGNKRRALLGDSPCITVDFRSGTADYSDVRHVPPDLYDSVLLCTPDGVKQDLVHYFVAEGKHVMIEKPFSLTEAHYDELESLQNSTCSTIYVAYNHRFEPHIATTKEILDGGGLGRIYTVSLSYGNGTAELVRASEWRDSGLGVIPDLGSHLLDMVDFWWGLTGRSIDFIQAQTIENRAYDHAVFHLSGSPDVWAETTMLSWRNDFRCDIRAEQGSLHISSLCKWGPSSLTVRGRVRPSGRPEEQVTTLIQSDPTWAAETQYFERLIKDGDPGNLSSSREISRVLSSVATELRSTS